MRSPSISSTAYHYQKHPHHRWRVAEFAVAQLVEARPPWFEWPWLENMANPPVQLGPCSSQKVNMKHTKHTQKLRSQIGLIALRHRGLWWPTSLRFTQRYLTFQDMEQVDTYGTAVQPIINQPGVNPIALPSLTGGIKTIPCLRFIDSSNLHTCGPNSERIMHFLHFLIYIYVCVR